MMTILRWIFTLMLCMAICASVPYAMHVICSQDPHTWGINEFCELGDNTTVQFMMNTFFNVAVSHSCVIVATMWWCWLRSEKNSEHKSTTNYAIFLNATRKNIMINIKLLSLPLACAVPCFGELFYGGSDGEFGLSDIFNGALFFTLVTPTFYVCMYAYVQFINGLYTCLAPSRKGCPNPTENKEYYNLMWWFILKLLGLLTFFSILLVADDKLGDFIIFGINTDLFDLRLGGVGPYSMVIIAMVRVSLTYSNERSYIALKVEQREKNEGETEEEEDQEIEQDLEEKEKKKKKGRKKKKKKEKGCCNCSFQTFKELQKFCMYTFLQMPFTYNWVMFTVLYLTAAVNVMFHLMVSASIKEGIFESLLKIGLLVLTGWNMLSPLSMLVKLTIDSWEDLDYLTLNIIDAFARINYVATNGSFIRDLPEEIVRMHGYEIFDDIDIDKSGNLSTYELSRWRESMEADESFSPNDNFDNLLKQFEASKEEDTDERKKFAILWASTFSKNKKYAAIILDASPKDRTKEKVRTGMRWMGIFLGLGCSVLVGMAKITAYEEAQPDAGKAGFVNDTNIVFDSDSGRNTVFRGTTNRNDVNINWENRFEIPAPTKPAYAICPMRWHGLSSLDYSILSGLSYLDWTNELQLKQMKQILAASFPTSIYGDVTIMEDWNQKEGESSRVPEDVPPNIFKNFLQFKFPKQKLIVIGIQGTNPSNPMEVIADLRMWFESSSLNAASVFLPTVKMMSLELTSRLVYAMNLLQHFFEVENVDLDFHEAVVKYAFKVKKNLPNDWNLAVTGHSLGGGISSIVGSTVSIDSIAFSPPGMTASRYKFKSPINNDYMHPEVEHAARHSVNFLPLRDIVPKTDGHFGLVQNTICNYKNPMMCHSIELMVCDLIRRCGDGYEGKRFAGCAFRHESLEEHRYDMFPAELDNQNIDL